MYLFVHRKRCLSQALIPLHSAPRLETYQEQLCICLVQYLRHDSSFIVPILTGLFKYWTYYNHKKELLLLDELQECVQQLVQLPARNKELGRVVREMGGKLVGCMQLHSHALVAKKTICLLEDQPEVLQLVAKDKGKVM